MASTNAGVRMFYTRPSDGATYCFEPVPLLSESKEFLSTLDSRLGTVNTLTFNGYLLPSSPALSGVDPGASCIELLDRKSDQMTSALSEDFGDLLVVDGSGYPVIVTKPKVLSLNFDESQIVNHRPYSVVFEYESDFASNQKIREFGDSWSFSQNEDDTISVSHSVNAAGISQPDLSKTAISNARDFVLLRTGLDKTQAVFLQSPVLQSYVSVDSLSAFNHVLSETSDIPGGNYSVDETWTLASGNFKDDRTIDHSFELNGNQELIETISINGTVQGYGDTTHDKFSNAVSAFVTIASDIGFNATSGIVSKQKSENRFTGQVTYSLTLAPDSKDSLTGRSISRTFERQEDGSVIQSVQTGATLRPGSALTIDDAIDYCFTNNFPIDSVTPPFSAALSGNLRSVSTARDDVARSFSLSRSFVDQTTLLYIEQYQVQRQQGVDTSQTVISINGTVQGLGVESTSKSEDRFASASGAYFNSIEPLITGRIAEIVPTGSCIDSSPTSYTLGYNRQAGVITYSKTFNNRFLTSNVNILDEKIQLSFALGGDVVAVIPIPGKADGPILQDQETKTGLSKTLNITYTMRASPTQCSGIVSGSNALTDIALSESNILIDNTPLDHSRGEKPTSSAVFKTADTFNFDRQTNAFTRSVTWLYL